eukprot:5805346-Prymnesium_polylepis.1
MLHDRKQYRNVSAPLGSLGRGNAQGDERCSAGSTCVVPWLLVASSGQIPRLALCVDCVKGARLRTSGRGANGPGSVMERCPAPYCRVR